MNYRFEGPYPGRKDPRTHTKGAMRVLRELKREEAERRNKLTPYVRTAVFRRLSLEEQKQWFENDQSTTLPETR